MSQNHVLVQTSGGLDSFYTILATRYIIKGLFIIAMVDLADYSYSAEIKSIKLLVAAIYESFHVYRRRKRHRAV